METIWDPLRKKDVSRTPEEEVRQWFIGRLHKMMGVPLHMMMSEVGFNLGQKKFRADILIYGRDTRPVAVVECKRPSVAIDARVLEQAVRYNMVLNVKYIFITNGEKTCILGRHDTEAGPGYGFVQAAPIYEDMIKD